MLRILSCMNRPVWPIQVAPYVEHFKDRTTFAQQAAHFEGLQQERSHLFTRREGFSYHFVQIEWHKGARFGLIIKAYEKFIVVSKLDPVSLCAKKLRVGDRLIDVDGKALTNKDDAKKDMVIALKKNKKVTFIVERPESEEAKCWAKDALKSASIRTSSTAPLGKHKWAKMSAEQRAKASATATSDGTECTLRTTE